MEATNITIQFLLITFLLLISNIHTTMAATTPTSSSKSNNNSLKIYKNFITSSCNSTTYPMVCYNSLSPYASTIKTDSLKLCVASLNVNLKSASKTYTLVSRITKNRVLNPSEKAAIKDCVEEIGNSIYELKKASKAMAKLSRGASLEGSIEDIITWVSAALTDEDTCTDGFDKMTKVRSSVKNIISKSVNDLGEVTSNTLALISRIRN